MIFDKILRYLRQRKIRKYIPRNSVVCDIGCGKDAHFLKSVKKFIKYGFGFDIEVNNYKDEKIKLAKADLEKGKLPLKNNMVDVVLMSAVIEHLENSENILKEIFRILRPKGFFILTTPTSMAKPVLEFLAFKLKIINQKDIIEHKRYFLFKDIKSLFIKFGFDKNNIKHKYFEFGFNLLVLAKK